MKLKSIGWITAAVLALLIAVTPLLANHSWNGYHWARTSNPFTVKLGDNVSSQWDTYLRQASSDWSQSTVLNTTVVAGTVSNVKRCPIAAGHVEVCNTTYGQNGWLGVASITVSGSHITGGSVKLNDTYFNSSTYNHSYWRALVTCQEVGHTFGLDHQDENFNNTNLGTCMDYTNNPLGPPDNEHPNKHDYDELVTIYSHLDSSTTVGQTTLKAPPAAFDLDFTTPGQWGRLVSMSEDGGQSIYELDFGGGNKVVTHVTWTVDEAARNRALLQQVRSQQ